VAVIAAVEFWIKGCESGKKNWERQEAERS